MATKSKTALLELKSDYQTAAGGGEILEQKRNIILKEIISMLEEVEKLRERVDESVQKSYRLLVKAFMESGKKRVQQESELISFKADIEVVRKSFIGVVVPEVSVKKSSKPLPVGYMGDTIYLDLARISFVKSVEMILKLSSMEIKVWRLAKELKKSVIRVNALKNYYLPKYRKEIKEIESSLEESEREFLVILKRLVKKG